jgi:hypothetical protein
LVSINGYTPVAGDRVLLTAQADPTENGPWIADSGVWARPTDDGSSNELEAGALWLVTAGTAIATQWRLSVLSPITIVQFSATAPYAAGLGLTLTGTTFAAKIDPAGALSVSSSGIAANVGHGLTLTDNEISAVAGNGILVNGAISVDPAVVVSKFAAAIGDASSTSIVVTHNLGTTDVHMQVQDGVSHAVVECDMTATSINTATFVFTVAPGVGAFRAIVFG